MGNGFLLIDKPKGWTSFDVVARLRTITGIKKIGHAGTLDPLATGLLIVAIGREATKRISHYVKLSKVYTTRTKLGEVSDSYDADGRVKFFSEQKISREQIDKALEKFTGSQQQVPPMFSAKKVKGKKLYELARQGKEIKRQPAEIIISKLEIEDFSYPWLELLISCSSGTYVRSLVHDIGQELGTGAVVYELRRLSIGDFSVETATQLDQLNQENWTQFLWPSK